MRVLALASFGFAAPQFLDYSALQDSTILVHEGSYFQEDGLWCCEEQSNCAVEVIYDTGKNFVSDKLQASRYEDQTQGTVIISDYSIGKQMLVNQSNYCIEYCPLKGAMPPLCDPTSQDIGKAVIDGHQCEGWRFNVTLGPIPMESFTLWVDQASGLPVELIQEITPYGVDFATASCLYSNFTNGAQDPKLFAVPNAGSCPMSRSCNSQGFQVPANHANLRRSPNRSVKSRQVPQLPSNWQSQQISSGLQTAGFAVQPREGLWCCQGSCSIETQYAKTEYYMDAAHNRTRTDDLDAKQTIIDDYTARKQILVKSATDLTCVSYCDIDWALSPYQLDSNATDLGPVTIEGKTYEKWQWSVYSKFHKELEIVVVYVDQSNASLPIPFLEADHILVPTIADVNVTFRNYTAGVPAQSFFAYSGLSTCKPSHDCPM